MKKLTGVLGCAVVAGLMTFAAGNVQAGVVINNDVYSPLKLKISAQYVDSNGNLKKTSITSKQVLQDLGYNSNVQLAQASFAPFDVWVINKDMLVRNLSTNNILTMDYSFVVSSQKKNAYKEAGVLTVSFESDDSADAFDVSGVYTYSSNSSNTDNNGNFNFKEMLKANDLSGSGFFPTLSNSDVPATGSASYKGSGKLVD